MRMVRVAQSLLSGVILYLLVAACSAYERSPHSGADASGILDPVGDVNAAPSEQAVEPCNTVGHVGNTDYLLAVHQFSGKSVVELSALRAVGHVAADGGPPIINGHVFDSSIATLHFQDGAAAAVCGTRQNPWFDTVTFVGP